MTRPKTRITHRTEEPAEMGNTEFWVAMICYYGAGMVTMIYCLYGISTKHH